MTRKIVYNNCFGGFTLSKEGVLLGRKLTGDPLWGGACLKGDVSPCGFTQDYDYGSSLYDIPRHDSILVQVVETLGKAANGSCSKLAIYELPDGIPYRIEEYDGNETVVTMDMMEWMI